MDNNNNHIDTNTLKIGFIGAGVMASAIISGLLNAKFVQPSNICASNIITTDNALVVAQSDIIIIAVKPDVVGPVLDDLSTKLAPEVFEKKCFISIAAGISIHAIEARLPQTTKGIIRVMPNTACMVGMSASAYAANSRTSRQDKDICEKIFSSVGTICEVDEKLMDAVTGLSGSGPAYVFMFIEALADGGVRMGLPRAAALQLAAQTVKGAATMVLETQTHPGQLKDQVCSPGGTTIAGVEALEEHSFRAAAMSAVVAASKRGISLLSTIHPSIISIIISIIIISILGAELGAMKK